MTLTGQEHIFVVVFLINLLVALLYLLCGVLIIVPVRHRKKEGEAEILRDNRRSYLLRFLVMVFCPVIGPVFFFTAHLLYLTIFRFQMDIEDVIFSKERVRTQLKADEERERNVVSIEEAIAVGDKKNLRTAMLSALRGKIDQSLSSIALALDTEDSESAHYAASILSDELSRFRMRVQRLAVRMKEQEEDETGCEEELLGFMDDVLKQKVFTDPEQEKFVRMMEEAAESLYKKAPEKIAPEQYEGVALRLMELKDYALSEKWCIRLSQQYPQELISYTCRLKLYFTSKNREAFFQTLDALKSSDIVIDNETLELIRIFS